MAMAIREDNKIVGIEVYKKSKEILYTLMILLFILQQMNVT